MSSHGVIHILDSSSGKARPLQLTNNILSVDASGSTIPISAAGTLNTNDSSANSTLSSIDLALGGTLTTNDTSANTTLTSIDSALSGTIQTNDSSANLVLSSIESYISGTLSTTSSTTKSATQVSNSQSVVSGDFSTSSHNCSSERELVVVGTTTDFSNNIDVWISNDNSTYYKHGSYSMYPDSSGNFSIQLDCPFKYIKLKFNGSGSVSALVMGSN